MRREPIEEGVLKGVETEDGANRSRVKRHGDGLLVLPETMKIYENKAPEEAPIVSSTALSHW